MRRWMTRAGVLAVTGSAVALLLVGNEPELEEVVVEVSTSTAPGLGAVIAETSTAQAGLGVVTPEISTASAGLGAVILEVFIPDCNRNGVLDVNEPTTTRTFCVTCRLNQDCSNGHPWSVRVDFGPGTPFHEELSCGPVPTDTNTAKEMGAELVDCINQLCPPSVRAAIGTPEAPANTCFDVTAPGTSGFRLCVGLPGGPSNDCCAQTTPGPPGTPPQVEQCKFNPDLVEVILSGEDCNQNGVDDATDIALETSQDDNRNGIPDECDEGVPTISEWGVVILTLLLLTGLKINFARRRSTQA